MSKGSKQRPSSVDKKTFDSNWDKIFKENKRKKIVPYTTDGNRAVHFGEEHDQSNPSM